MTLNDRLADLNAATTRRCPTQRLIDSLPDEERKSLTVALDNPNLSTLKIHGALQLEGYRLGRPALQDHRSGRCYCSDSLR